MTLLARIRSHLAATARTATTLVTSTTLAVTAAVAATAIGGAATASASSPTADIVRVAAAVPDSYIVVLKPTRSLIREGVPNTARGLIQQFGGRVGSTYRHALKGFEVSLSDARARRLAAHPAVAYVQQNGIHRIDATQTPTPSWGLDRVDQRNLPLNDSYTYPVTGSGVRAYIIDTGVRFSHTDFGGRAVTGFDAIDGGSADDGHGHGTHVAGTVGGTAHGVAKGVTIVGVRVLNDAGTGTTAEVVAGVDWVTGDHDPGELAVANMSLGGGANPAIDTAVANSIADGVSYSVAAGNETGSDACTRSPARTPAAITVGSTTSTDVRSSFSNIGTCLDIFAPGSSITSAWNTSDIATNTISGTSMATPHVAGAAALVLARNASFTPQQVRDSLVNIATSGVISDAGAGSPNRLLFIDNTTPPVNNFALAVSPTAGTTSAGGSTTATVNTTTTSGSPQTMNLSATGLPAGTTATFVPSSITSGASSALTIRTSASTPVGRYSISVTGRGPWATRTAIYTLTVTSAGTCGSPGQKLVNPGFESGATGWSATPGVIGQWGRFQPLHWGTWTAYLNGYGRVTTDTLTQSVALPVGCSSYSLSFWVHIDSSEATTTTIYDRLQVQVITGGVTTTLATYSNLNEAPGYALKSFNLSAYAGRTISLRFVGTEDDSLQTSFVVDDTAINVS